MASTVSPAIRRFGKRVTPADPSQLALSIRNKADLGDDPLDIFAFLNGRDDIVLIRRFGDSANIDGIYIKDEKRRVGFIYVNRAKPIGRQHFTAAHEFGHHVLGHGEEFDADIFAEGQSGEETAANRFAAELLLPRPGLIKFVSRKTLDVTRLPDAIRVARHFQVTLKPALIQLHAIDRLSGVDYGRLLHEFESVKPNPLAAWETLDASFKTELPPRFVEHVKAKYLRGEITVDAASEALDVPVEVITDRFGSPEVTVPPSDLTDIF
jgi:Zn-dependent peptidase ImmA (M78 family)